MLKAKVQERSQASEGAGHLVDHQRREGMA